MSKKQEIEDYLDEGYIITHRDKEYITLREPKHEFSWLAFILWTIFTFGLGFYIYLIYHFVKHREEITIENGGRK